MPAKKEKNRLPEKKMESNNAKRLMWFSVILFSAAIAIIWGWSLKTQLSSISWQKMPEKELIQKGQQEWDKLFAAQQNQLQEETAESDVKKLLAKS